jgi:hypothetical protein
LIKEEEQRHQEHLTTIQDNMKHLCRSKFEKNCRSKNLNISSNIELTAIGAKAEIRAFEGVNEKDLSISDDIEDLEEKDDGHKKKKIFESKSDKSLKFKENRMT